MKILQINKFHYIEGGTERYYLELSKVLERHGHEIAHFSMQDPRNFKSKWSKYFVSNLSFRNVDYRLGLKIIGRMIYSIEAKKKINELLDSFTPNIVHIHNIYNHISPSILPEIKKRNIPIVQTIHDYHLIAPNKNLFHGEKICEITKKNVYYKAIFHRCIKNSYSASFLTAITMYIHRFSKIYLDNIDHFLTPSKFIKQKLIEYGFNAEKITVIPNFITIDGNIKKESIKIKKNYILYIGRLSSEKGLDFLLEIVRKLPNIHFKIAGTGPQESQLRKKSKKYGLKNIFFLGYQPEWRRKWLIKNSYFSIFPSLWYEGFGLVVLESNVYGKPLIASRIGGISEVIEDKITGLLFEPGNINDCIEKILTMWKNTKLVRELGKNARVRVFQDFNERAHYNRLMQVYQAVMKKYESRSNENSADK